MILQSLHRAGAVILLACACVLASAHVAAARQLDVTPQTFAETLAQAGPNDTLVLAPGDYPRLTLNRSGAQGRPLTLRAADPNDRPVFPGLEMFDAQFVRLDRLIFDLPRRAHVDRSNFTIRRSADLMLTGLLFNGASRPTDKGLMRPWGFGLQVIDSTDVEFLNNEIRGFDRGLIVTRTMGIRVADNLLHSLRSDGMNFSQVTDVIIENNVIRDFDRAIGAGDHPDMIQFWTRGTTAPSTGILIRNNLLSSGDGAFTQSIFMRNELVDTHKNAEEMYYRDVVIENNVIINAHLHGITVGETMGLTIKRNTVVRNATSQGEVENAGLWTPRINVAPDSRDVLILNNVAHSLPEIGAQPGWVIAGNQRVQDRTPGQANHYDQVFLAVSPSRPAKLVDFAARPDGLLAGRDVGAARLIEVSNDVAAAAGPDVRETGAQPLRGQILLDPVNKVILADGGSGAVPLTHLLETRQIRVGKTFAPVVLTRDMTSPLFDTPSFVIDMRLRPTGDHHTAGEVLRLHQSLKVSVTGRGVIEVELVSARDRVVRMKSRATALYRNGELDITIAYDGPGETIAILSGDKTIGIQPFSGPTLPMQDWGLSFGNPFGTHQSFEGVIEAFQVITQPGDMADTFDRIDRSFRR